jgi:phytoene/squalene synthetase
MSASDPAPVTDLARYSQCAQDSAARVISAYSTSFGMAARLLDRRIRPHVRNVYGLVRVADEIVDGAAAEAGLDATALGELLDGLEAETLRAIEVSYSANLVVHAFGGTARYAGIRSDLVTPFFDSMRRDLDPRAYQSGEIGSYIYGSAEVVGLMCLRIFLADQVVADDERTRLEEGARRLGAAFQKVNFLRDLAADWQMLGRNYFPDIDPNGLTESQKLQLVDDIDADLAAARAVIPDLPRGARGAVAAAHGLFAALNDRIRATPAERLMRSRVRVTSGAKLRILAEASLGGVTAQVRSIA